MLTFEGKIVECAYDGCVIEGLWMGDIKSSIFLTAPDEVVVGAAVHGYGVFDA